MKINDSTNSEVFERLDGPKNFLLTQEYQRFSEFCIACIEERYIGICYGKSGVGKTLSARNFAQWDLYRKSRRPFWVIEQEDQSDQQQTESLAKCNTFFHTTPVLAAPKKNRKMIAEGILELAVHIRQIQRQMGKTDKKSLLDYTQLLLIDEADRLKMTALEELRDLYDHLKIGMILIGMPGLQKRLSRFPQFYSRIGFAHEFRALNREQSLPVIEHFWKETSAKWLPKDNLHQQAIADLYRITHGNFRLIQRIFQQIKRILKINHLKKITPDVIQTARDCLVIGNSS